MFNMFVKLYERNINSIFDFICCVTGYYFERIYRNNSSDKD